MGGFDAIYQQTVTLFNRVLENGEVFWYPTVLENVHLIVDKSILIATYGEHCSDNARLHVRYLPSGRDVLIGEKTYLPPKQFASEGDPEENLTFAFGDNFDFIMEGEYGSTVKIPDADYRNGFFNYMNRAFDNVFAITSASKLNLIPHFEISAR